MTPPGTPSVSVVVITYRRPDYVRRCLECLHAQTEPAQQILVVDSSDDTLTTELVAVIPGIDYLRDPSWAGDMTASRNAALSAVTGDVIAFLDDDAFAAPAYVAALRAAYRDSGIGLACSRTLNGAAGEEHDLGAGIGRLLENGELTGHFACAVADVTTIDHGIGATMSFRRDTLAALGGFRRGYRGTCVREETDAFLRARALGFRAVYIPAAVAEHVAAPHIQGRRFDLRYDYWYYRNHALLLMANFGAATPLLPRWLVHGLWELAREHERTLLGRTIRLGVRAGGAFQGVAIGLLRGRGRRLRAAGDDALSRQIRARLLGESAGRDDA